MNLNFEEFSSLMIKKIWIEASLISNTTDAFETKHDRRNTFAKSNKVTFDPITLLQTMLVVQRKTMHIFISNDTIEYKIYPFPFLINNEKFALRRINFSSLPSQFHSKSNLHVYTSKKYHLCFNSNDVIIRIKLPV